MHSIEDYSLPTMEDAEYAVWDILEDEEIETDFISITGTVENILNDYSLQDIMDGIMDNQFILDSIIWLD